MSDRVRLAREIAARTKPRFIEIKREKCGGVPFTEEELTRLRSRNLRSALVSFLLVCSPENSPPSLGGAANKP